MCRHSMYIEKLLPWSGYTRSGCSRSPRPGGAPPPPPSVKNSHGIMGLRNSCLRKYEIQKHLGPKCVSGKELGQWSEIRDQRSGIRDQPPRSHLFRAYGDSIRREGEIIGKTGSEGARMQGARNQWVRGWRRKSFEGWGLTWGYWGLSRCKSNSRLSALRPPEYLAPRQSHICQRRRRSPVGPRPVR